MDIDVIKAQHRRRVHAIQAAHETFLADIDKDNESHVRAIEEAKCRKDGIDSSTQTSVVADNDDFAGMAGELERLRTDNILLCVERDLALTENKMLSARVQASETYAATWYSVRSTEIEGLQNSDADLEDDEKPTPKPTPIFPCDVATGSDSTLLRSFEHGNESGFKPQAAPQEPGKTQKNTGGRKTEGQPFHKTYKQAGKLEEHLKSMEDYQDFQVSCEDERMRSSFARTALDAKRRALVSARRLERKLNKKLGSKPEGMANADDLSQLTRLRALIRELAPPQRPKPGKIATVTANSLKRQASGELDVLAKRRHIGLDVVESNV